MKSNHGHSLRRRRDLLRYLHAVFTSDHDKIPIDKENVEVFD